MNRTIGSRLVLTGAALLMAVSLTSCGDKHTSEDPKADVPTAPSSSAASEPAKPTYDTEFDIAKPAIMTSAIVHSGRKDAKDATAAAVEFVTRYSWDARGSELPYAKVAQHAQRATSQMTAANKARWMSNVNGFVTDMKTADAVYDSEYAAPVLALSYEGIFSWDGTGKGNSWKNAPGPKFINPKVTKVQTSQDGERLLVKVWSRADARVIFKNKGHLVLLARNIKLWMKQEGGDWKVDGWYGGWNYRSKKFPLDPGPQA
jgi:predicted small lipoprotein YifL